MVEIPVLGCFIDLPFTRLLKTREAITKSLSDIERQYNNKLGLEAIVETLQNKVNELYKARLRNELLSLPQVAETISKWSKRASHHQHSRCIRKVWYG